ncbi:unnamed protein product, partial [Phaeothamnion confervicola]
AGEDLIGRQVTILWDKLGDANRVWEVGTVVNYNPKRVNGAYDIQFPNEIGPRQRNFEAGDHQVGDTARSGAWHVATTEELDGFVPTAQGRRAKKRLAQAIVFRQRRDAQRAEMEAAAATASASGAAAAGNLAGAAAAAAAAEPTEPAAVAAQLTGESTAAAAEPTEAPPPLRAAERAAPPAPMAAAETAVEATTVTAVLASAGDEPEHASATTAELLAARAAYHHWVAMQLPADSGGIDGATPTASPDAADTAASAAAFSAWAAMSSPGRLSSESIPLATEALQYSALTAEIIVAATETVDGPLPWTVAEALDGPEAAHWMSAMREELTAHKHNRTWRRSSRRPPPGRTIIGSRWVFTKKRAEDGTILRYKARLVGQGFTQRPGVDYDATFAPVMSADAIFFLLSLGAEFGFEVRQMDVVTAYLNAPLTEQLWMRPPPGPFGFEGCVALELLKAIYGLKQAAYLWHICLRTWLLSVGFEAVDADCCIFVRGDATPTAAASGSKGTYLVVGIHVDDLLTTGTPTSAITDFKTEISRRFAMKDMGRVHTLLGILVQQDLVAGTIRLSQPHYVTELLARFRMSDAWPVLTPVCPGAEALNAAMAPSTLAEAAEMARKPFRELVGALLYLAVTTRPDIFDAVRALSRFCNNPGHAHWLAALCLLRYLKGTLKKGLLYSQNASIGTAVSGGAAIGFADADWARDVDNRRSVGAY